MKILLTGLVLASTTATCSTPQSSAPHARPMASKRAWLAPFGPAGRVTDVRDEHELTVDPPEGRPVTIVVNAKQARGCLKKATYPDCLPASDRRGRETWNYGTED